MRYPHSSRKVVVPHLSSSILHRSSLITKLDALVHDKKSDNCNVILLCAPAGYGKTTLLADFAAQTALSCCWYELDQADIDTRLFIETLAQSIHHQFPHFNPSLKALVEGYAPSIVSHRSTSFESRTLVKALVAAITQDISTPFTLMLCNYHKVNAYQAINTVVNQLVEHLPAHCTLIIESRAVPSLELAFLAAQSRLYGLSQGDLQFTGQEIYELARLQGTLQLSITEAEQLAESFEGWITGILLGTRLGSPWFFQRDAGEQSASSVPMVSASRSYLLPYLINEVFKHEQEMYAFLKDASILQRMTPTLCIAITGAADAEECLHYLDQQGLFVTRDGGGELLSYSCHPVLKDFLQEELRKTVPERFVALHRRAAECFREMQDYQIAVYHALEAQADELVIDLILESHEELLSLGYAETIARWIDALPPEKVAHHPTLLLIRATTAVTMGEHTQSLTLLEQASMILSASSNEEDAVDRRLWETRIAIVRCRSLFQIGDYLQVQEACQHVLAHVPPDQLALRAEAHMLLGMSANVSGDFPHGIVQLQKALQLWRRKNDLLQMVDVHSILANAYSLVGNFTLAEHHLSQALSSDVQIHDERSRVYMLIRAGLTKQRQGLLSQAEDVFKQALMLSRDRLHFQRGEAYALVYLGELYQEQELYSQSLASTEEGLLLAHQIGDNHLVRSALRVLALTYLFMGDASTSMMLVREPEYEDIGKNQTNVERIVGELTHGTILLHLQRYEESILSLENVERQVQTMRLKRELLQTGVRLAAAYLASGKSAEAAKYMERVVLPLIQNGYEKLFFIELKRLPHLQHFVESSPETRRIQAVLQTTQSDQEEYESQIPILSSDNMSEVPSKRLEITINALGEPAVFVNSELITHWRRARAMELLFFLLDRSKPLHKEHIIAELWSEDEEPTDQAFRSAVHCLRKLFGESCILSQGGTYTLDLSSSFTHVYYDVALVLENYRQAKVWLDMKNDDEAQALLLQVVDAYQGDYVQSFYSTWCISRRDELRLLYLDALYILATLAWSQEKYDESIVYWQQALTVDHCLEEAHHGLMNCYLRQGKRGMALRQYQHCVEILQDELGVTPSQTLQSFYHHFAGDLTVSRSESTIP